MRTFLVICALAPGAWGDLLTLADGETLSGSVVRVRDSVLVYRTTLSGMMAVPMDTLQSLATDRTLLITLDDGSTITGKLQPNNGINRFIPLQGGEPAPIDLTRVVQAEVIPGDEREAPAPPMADSLKANLEIGALGRSGNVDGVGPYVAASLESEGKTARLRTRALLSQDEEAFPAWLRGDLQLDSSQNAWSPYGRLDVERDDAGALDLRTDLALGVRYRRDAGPDAYWEALGGLALTYEDPDTTERHPLLSKDRPESETDLTLQLGLRYSRALFGKGTLSGTMLVFPRITDASAVRLKSETSVTYPLTRMLHLRLNLLLDYESDPILDGMGHWDAGMGAGLSVSF